MLLSGTKQINCISLEFPLLHQSAFLADVREKLQRCPCHLSELCFVQQRVQGELGQDALCHARVVGLRDFPSSRGPCALGEGVILSSPGSVPGGTWAGTLKGNRCLFQSVLKQTLSLINVIAWDRTSAGGHVENLRDAARMTELQI